MDRAKFPVNQIITLEMPNSGVSDEGIAQINAYLATQKLPALPDTFEREWLVTKGDNVGTFPKRWATLMFKRFKHRATSEQLGKVGTLAQQHCLKHHRFFIDFDEKLNWRAGDFGDAQSCFWGGRTTARDMLRGQNSLALRFFHDEAGKQGYARAWLAFPNENTRITISKGSAFTLEQVRESFLKEGVMIFNAYGLELVRMARVLATYLGYSYQRSDIHNRGGDDGILYLNGGTGYLLAMPEVAEIISSVDLNIRDTFVACSECGNRTGPNNIHAHNGREYCDACWRTHFGTCDHCAQVIRRRDAERVQTETGEIRLWCRTCLYEHGSRCDHCDNYAAATNVSTTQNGNHLCNICIGRFCTHCESCNGLVYGVEVQPADDKRVCVRCLRTKYVKQEDGQFAPINKEPANVEAIAL